VRASESAASTRPSEAKGQAALRLSLVTMGDPNRQTGGYRYHRKMARAASTYEAEIRFRSIPDLPWPLPMGPAAGTLRAAAVRSDAIVLDSLAAAFAAPWIRRSRVPVIAVLHQAPGGVGHGRFRSVAQGALDRLAYRHASGFIAAGQGLVDALRWSGVSEDRIRFVPPGCDVPFGGGPPLDLRRGRDVAVLCVANWTPTKGIVELLDAFASLPEKAATLWLVGATDVDRRYAERVRRRISAPDLFQRVVVRGALPYEEVARMYRSADVFALCSLVDAYGTAWAEAIAAGLPVVGWRTANLPRLAEHGREALMPEPGDLRGLASALHAVTGNASLRARLAAGARRRAGTLPTWRRSEELFFEAVRELLAAPAKRRARDPRIRRAAHGGG
jgi:glycosyltransferase involved in cell wall biosynthesis